MYYYSIRTGFNTYFAQEMEKKHIYSVCDDSDVKQYKRDTPLASVWCFTIRRSIATFNSHLYHLSLCLYTDVCPVIAKTVLQYFYIVIVV